MHRFIAVVMVVLASAAADAAAPPVAFLLSWHHGYEPVNHRSKMLDYFPMDKNDLELRELFNVAQRPAGVVEGKPAAPDVQSPPGGVYGNLFDVLVDRPERAKSIFDDLVVWAAGDVDLGCQWSAVLEDQVRKGGTHVVNIEAAKELAPKLLGLQPTGKSLTADEWAPAVGESRPAVPFEVVEVEKGNASVLAWAGKAPLVTRNAVGEGAVIVTLVPRLLGLDERAHPALPHLMNGLTAGLLAVEVRRAGGSPLQGEVMYQVNLMKDGWLVMFMNNNGVDRAPNGVARVDRRAFADVVLRTALPVRSVKEYTRPRELAPEKGEDGTEVQLGVQPGAVQVGGIAVK